MKNTFIKGIIFILLGYFIGTIIFSNKIKAIEKLLNKDTYYFLEQGSYKNEKILQNNISNITNKIIEKEKNKYIVYVGITKDKNIAEKLKKAYKNMNIDVVIREKYLSNKEFSNNVDQFDFLIKSTNSKDELMTIEEVILANYEELIKNNVNKRIKLE